MFQRYLSYLCKNNFVIIQFISCRWTFLHIEFLRSIKYGSWTSLFSLWHGARPHECKLSYLVWKIFIGEIIQNNFQSAFHFGYCENVLFDVWKVRSVGTLVGSVCGIIAMAVLFEALKAYRQNIKFKFLRVIQFSCISL